MAVSSFCHQSVREWTKNPLFVPSRTIFGRAPGSPALPAMTLRVQPLASEVEQIDAVFPVVREDDVVVAVLVKVHEPQAGITAVLITDGDGSGRKRIPRCQRFLPDAPPASPALQTG